VLHQDRGGSRFLSVNQPARPDDKMSTSHTSPLETLVRYQATATRWYLGIVRQADGTWLRSNSSGATARACDQNKSFGSTITSTITSHAPRVFPCGGRTLSGVLSTIPLPTARGTRPQDPGDTTAVRPVLPPQGVAHADMRVQIRRDSSVVLGDGQDKEHKVPDCFQVGFNPSSCLHLRVTP